MPSTLSVAIVGASGYTGGELVRLLARHEEVRITHVTSERHAGKPLHAAFPHLAALPTLMCQPLATLSDVTDLDVVFCALPHLASMQAIPGLLQRGARVVDLSADFRLKNPDHYRTWYGAEHQATDLLPEAVYGLPERYRERIATARLVANPGCYPTSAILALMPLLKEGLIDTRQIVIDSKSGISGAGRAASQGALFSETEGGFKAYKVNGHRHTPEIEQELSLLAGEEISLRFVPHLIPQSRGILSTCHLRPHAVRSPTAWREVMADFYRDEPFVHVLEPDIWPATNHVRGSNQCHIGVAVDPRSGWMTVLSTIDNLVKGAAGQAVQNMNVMFGLDERTGLTQLPLFP